MRLLPIYKQAQSVNFSELDAPHAGLWFEKFFSDFEADYSGHQKNPQMYQDIVKTQAQPEESILQSYFHRHLQLVKAQKGQTQLFENQWHFVTGMGQAHPIENGFSFHPLLGCPYLAGSALKGLLRHWVKFYLQDDNKVTDWFGSEDDQNPQIGSLIFFDALPVKRPKLLVDIMTPHYGDWYLKGANGTIAPDDSHEPVPIPFLVVDKKTPFAVSIASRKQGNEAVSDIEQALEMLSKAFELLGAGAKTATGYGRLSANETLMQKLQSEFEAQAKADNMSEFQKQLYELYENFKKEGGTPNVQAAQPLRAFIMEAMQNQLDQLSLADRQALEEVVDAYKPSKKQKKAYQALQKALKETLK